MSNAKIKAIIKRPDEKYGHMTNISNTLENLQRTVEGYIATVTLGEVVLIVNDEGLINGSHFNCTVAGIDLFGTIIVAGVDGEEFGDVPISFKEWKDLIE